MFNGNGLTRTTNDNDKFQHNARLMWQPNGSQVLNQRAWVTGALYSESDFESTTSSIYAVAINWDSQNNFNATTGTDQKWHAFSLDGIYKHKGFSVNGMYAFANRKPETGAEFDADGYFIQAGKLFSRRRYEVAVRYGESDPSDPRHHEGSARRLQLLLRASRTEIADRLRPGGSAVGHEPHGQDVRNPLAASVRLLRRGFTRCHTN